MTVPARRDARGARRRSRRSSRSSPACCACAVAARSTGAMDPLVFVEDAGPLVRWSVPLVRVGHDVAAAVTLGALVFAASLIPDAGRCRRAGRADPAVATAIRPRRRPTAPACVARRRSPASSGRVTALAGVVLTFADAAGLPLSSPALAPQLTASSGRSTRPGSVSSAPRAPSSSRAGPRSRAAGAPRPGWQRSPRPASSCSVWPATPAPPTTTRRRSTRWGCTCVGATMWVGGLIVLVVAPPHARRASLAVVAGRYSTLALVVLRRGRARRGSSRRRPGWARGPTSARPTACSSSPRSCSSSCSVRPGGGTGARRSPTSTPACAVGRSCASPSRRSRSWGRRSAIATALSRSAPPVPEDFPDPTPTLQITGFPAPPDPSTTAWWEVWRADWLVLAAVVVALGLYAAGVLARPRRLRAAPSSVESHRRC